MTRRLTASLAAAAGLCVALVAVLGFNVWRLRSRHAAVVPVAVPALPADAAERLAGAVRLQTISYETPSAASLKALVELHAYLRAAFPRVDSTLRRELVNQYSLLYTWPGRNSALAPMVLMAHQDVVPIAPGSESGWHAGPFSGEIRDGFVWGRGAWDDKGNLMAMLEAAESLAETGFVPLRTVYFVFGHDEENRGEQGAKAVASLLRERGIRPQFVLDEGLLIANGMLPGVDRPVALIGVAEKGSATFRITATAPPGHSSMPGARTAIGSLARVLAHLERQPMTPAMRPVVRNMFEALAPETHGVTRLALSNLWLTRPLVMAQLARGPSTDAVIRTTTAITEVHGGNKSNVLPESAEALVNFRLIPGETVADVTAHVDEAARGEPVGIAVLPESTEASPVASSTSDAYRLIERTVRALNPDVAVVPGLMIGGTDSRHFQSIAENVYRFSPLRAGPADLARIHGTDERMSLENYAELIAFYRLLISGAAADAPGR